MRENVDHLYANEARKVITQGLSKTRRLWGDAAARGALRHCRGSSLHLEYLSMLTGFCIIFLFLIKLFPCSIIFPLEIDRAAITAKNNTKLLALIRFRKPQHP